MQPVMDRPATVTYPTPSANWLQDPESGFLYIPDCARGSSNVFGVEQKKEFVAQYRARFPDLNSTLEQVGISRNTFYWHLKFDNVFREKVQDIKEAKMDTLESKMYEFAQYKSNFMDRIAMLRAHRPDIYTEKRIVLGAKDLDPSTLAHKAGHLGQVVDAELVGPSTQMQLVQGTGSQVPHSVTVNQEDSKVIADKKIP